MTVEQIIDVLNDAHKTDPIAMAALVENRTPCNKAMADHPTIQVAGEEGSWRVGLVGILCAIARLEGKKIAIEYDDADKFMGFCIWKGKVE